MKPKKVPLHVVQTASQLGIYIWIWYVCIWYVDFSSSATIKLQWKVMESCFAGEETLNGLFLGMTCQYLKIWPFLPPSLSSSPSLGVHHIYWRLTQWVTRGVIPVATIHYAPHPFKLRELTKWLVMVIARMAVVVCGLGGCVCSLLT